MKGYSIGYKTAVTDMSPRPLFPESTVTLSHKQLSAFQVQDIPNGKEKTNPAFIELIFQKDEQDGAGVCKQIQPTTCFVYSFMEIKPGPFICELSVVAPLQKWQS